jgi:hypothetical protein
VGEGVDQRERGARSEQAAGPGHSCRGVLGGAHVLAVGPEQEDEIRDYERLA